MITLEEFKDDLKNQSLDSINIVQKYLMTGYPYIFLDKSGIYSDLKCDIISYFGAVDYKNVLMVGSCLLGFSIAPKKEFLAIDFNRDSDIDMVIIDTDLFNRYWNKLSDFDIKKAVYTEQEQMNYYSFLRYFFDGWIRPDLLPNCYTGKKEWFDFFRSISYSKYDKRKVTGAIFHSEYFFIKYHVRNINRLREVLKNGKC